MAVTMALPSHGDDVAVADDQVGVETRGGLGARSALQRAEKQYG